MENDEQFCRDTKCEHWVENEYCCMKMEGYNCPYDEVDDYEPERWDTKKEKEDSNER